MEKEGEEEGRRGEEKVSMATWSRHGGIWRSSLVTEQHGATTSMVFVADTEQEQCGRHLMQPRRCRRAGRPAQKGGQP